MGLEVGVAVGFAVASAALLSTLWLSSLLDSLLLSDLLDAEVSLSSLSLLDVELGSAVPMPTSLDAELGSGIVRAPGAKLGSANY